MGHGVEREGAAPAPSPPAQALGVQLRILGQRRVHHGQLILKLHGAEVVIGGLGKGASAAAHAAIVGVEHGKAVLGQQLVEEQSVAPAVERPPAGRVRRRDSRSAGAEPESCPSGSSSVA